MKQYILFLSLLFSVYGFSQHNVSGHITAEDNEPLLGASIIEKGTNNGVISDFNGNFEINVSNSEATLIVSFIGFEEQEVSVQGKSRLNIIMTESAQSLAEVSVKGFAGIIGKARKRTESIQNTPESVTALNSQGIEDAGISNISEFAQFVPNLKLSSTQGTGVNFVTVRGIPQIRSADAPVAFVIDGVTIPDPSLLNQELFDLALIEVVKGPQGALYGKNAIGGAINIYSKEPTNASRHTITTGFGNGNSFLGQLVSSGAIVENKLFYRVSTQIKDYQGLLVNETLNEKADFQRDFNFRGQLIARITPKFKASATFQHLNGKGGATYYSVNPTGNLFVEGAPGGPLSPNPKKGNNIIASDEPGRSSLKNYFGNLNLEYTLDKVKLQSITSYNKVDRALTGDLDFTPFDDFTQGEKIGTETFNQEIRISNIESDSRLNWSAGGFYQNIENPFFQDGMSRDFDLDELFYAVSGDVFNTTETYALFGFADYKITNKFTASLGFRYDFDTFTQVDNLTNTTSERSNNIFQPKVSLSYQASETILLYTNYGRGYRTGGFNPAETTRFNRDYKDEISDNYEIGIKTSWWNNRFILNGSVFYNNFENQQQYAYDLITFFAGNYNYEKSTIFGFELDSKLRLTKNFDLLGSYGFVNPKIKEGGTTGGGATDLSEFNGNKTPFVPQNNYHVGIDSNFKLSNKVNLNANVNLNGTGKIYWFEDNIAESKAYELLDARATLSFNNIKVSIWGKNILDKQYFLEYYSGAQFGGFDDFGWRGRPATYGATVSYSF